MKLRLPLLVVFTFISSTLAQEVKRDIPYASPAAERQVLDVHAPQGAKNLPVVFWIHGGGWQTGDKSDVQDKPRAFTERGFVLVATNYRLLPKVDMETIIRDVAKSLGWVHKHIADHGGDPKRIFVMGHSAGAQLAALVCIDDRYLKAEGVPFDVLKGCVPVDGDTYDIPAMIETAETRRRVHKQPQAKFGHREKFGNDPQKHRDFSAVTHVSKGKRIPPFLILHVADHPDVTAQAQRLGAVLKESDVPATVFGAKDTNHTKINANIGMADDPVSKALFEFVAASPPAAESQVALKKGDHILFFGDSLTELAGREAPKPHVTKGYVRIVRETLEQRHKDQEIRVDWVATGGHTVPDLLKRLDKDVIERKPTIVVIQIGCNDARRIPKDRFQSGLEELIDRLRKAGIQVIQCTLTSVGEKHDGTNKDDTALEAFAEVARGVAKSKRVPLNDLRKAFVDYWKKNNSENKPSGLLTYDGNHWNDTGHQFVAEQMLKMFK